MDVHRSTSETASRRGGRRPKRKRSAVRSAPTSARTAPRFPRAKIPISPASFRDRSPRARINASLLFAERERLDLRVVVAQVNVPDVDSELEPERRHL